MKDRVRYLKIVDGQRKMGAMLVQSPAGLALVATETTKKRKSYIYPDIDRYSLSQSCAILKTCSNQEMSQA